MSVEKLKEEIERLKGELKIERENFDTLLNSSRDGLAIIDLESTEFLYVNEAYIEMTGYSRDELKSKTCSELTKDEYKLKPKEILEKLEKDGFIESVEKVCILKNREVAVNLSLTLMPDRESVLITTKDVTEIKNTQKKMQEYIEIIDKNVIISTTDRDGVITNASEAFCKISGYSQAELIGKKHSIIRHPDMPNSLYKDMWRVIKSGNSWRGEIKNLKKNFEFYWVDAIIYPNYDSNLKIVGYTSIRQDITDKKRIEKLLITDSLTGIFNRRYFNQIFSKEIERASIENRYISFIVADIDHFKQYNDRYGHQAGDRALIKVAKTLSKKLKSGYVFRLGGEEFGVLFLDSNLEESLKVANYLRESIEELKIEHRDSLTNRYVTISMGLITQKGEKIEREDRVYKLADDTLYKAKSEGRNRICY